MTSAVAQSAAAEVVRQHLLAELRDLDGGTASAAQLAGQVTDDPWAYQRVYAHLRELERRGLVRRVSVQNGRGCVEWALTTDTSGRVHGERTRR